MTAASIHLERPLTEEGRTLVPSPIFYTFLCHTQKCCPSGRTSVPISVKMMTVDCAGCQRPILDRFLLHFMDKTWHSQCVKCQLCRRLLDDKCFFRDGKIYCRDDFYRYRK